MYFPDNFAGLAALPEYVHRFVFRWRRAIGRVAPQTAETLTETPPDQRGLSVVSVCSRIDTPVDGTPGT
jgi:hypothetical protein